MRIEIQWNSLFPLSMPYVTTLQYREIFWQNGSLLYGSDTAKQEFFMRLQLRLQSLHKHDFISNQLLFYCWLTQQHFNFSVSFSFKFLGCPRKCYHQVMSIAPSSGHEWLNLNLPFKLILMRFEVVFWCLKWECCTFWKIDRNSILNPPILYYGFKF